MCSMHNKKHKHRRKAFYFLMVPIMIFGLGAVVMLLWNWLMPNLFELKNISYWEAVGLLVLCRILFGKFGPGGKKGGGHHHGPGSHFKQKWASMNEEERTAFKAKWKQRWKDHHHDEE